MKIARQQIAGKGFHVPCATITPPVSRGTAIVVHGYGGCKEEQLGLAWRVAEAGITAIAVDLRGHGEHPLPLDDRVLSDVENAVVHARKHGKVAVIGHSFGGRLALLSSADHVVAISPAFTNSYNGKTQATLTNVKSYRVREDYPGAVFDVVKRLPVWEPGEGRPVSLIIGSRDVPDIAAAYPGLKERGADVLLVDQAMHSDIFLTEATFSHVATRLKEWFGKP